MTDVGLQNEFDVWLHLALLNNQSNGWIEGDYSDVYVRYFMGQIQIANINIRPDKQHQGIFKAFLEHVESYNIPIKIENVLNRDLDTFLSNREGYTCKRTFGVPDFYRY